MQLEGWIKMVPLEYLAGLFFFLPYTEGENIHSHTESSYGVKQLRLGGSLNGDISVSQQNFPGSNLVISDGKWND